MRVPQLLAIAMVCLLAGLGSHCARIEQSIGKYQTSAALGPGADAPSPPQAGDAGTMPGQGGAGTVSSVFPDAGPPPPTLDAGPILSTFDDAGMPNFPANECAKSASIVEAVRKRLDIYILVDANNTTGWSGLFDYANEGLRLFVSDPQSRGIGVGLRYYGSQCQTDIYAEATVDVDTLPGNQGALVKAINASNWLNASPMAPALQGGINHQLKRSTSFPDTRQVVVLVTDGFTQDLTCSYSPQDLEDIASTGFHAPQSIASYIVALGVSDTTIPFASDFIERISPLDPIAAAGGTREANKLNYGTEPTALRDTLSAVRRSAQPCEYAVPAGTDTASTNLFFPSFGPVPRVTDEAACGDASGFFYDAMDAPNAPAWMKLCPADCKRLQAADNSAYLVLGCNAITR